MNKTPSFLNQKRELQHEIKRHVRLAEIQFAMASAQSNQSVCFAVERLPRV